MRMLQCEYRGETVCIATRLTARGETNNKETGTITIPINTASIRDALGINRAHLDGHEIPIRRRVQAAIRLDWKHDRHVEFRATTPFFRHKTAC